MIRAIKNHGFSLTEVLIAMAILATGMVFIAGIFPAAIHLSTVSVERVTASLAAEEAFANIRLYAQGRPEPDDFDDFYSSISNPSLNSIPHFSDGGEIRKGDQSFPFIIDESYKLFPATKKLDPNVFAYPSDDGRNIKDKQYFWSAVLRFTSPYDKDVNPRPSVQVTVFVCRKVQAGLKYYDPNEFYSNTVNPNATIDYPMAVPIKVNWDSSKPDRLTITDSEKKTFIDNGYTIVDDETGRIFRVVERLKGDSDNIIVLDRNWSRWGWNWNNAQQKYLWDYNATRDTNIRVWVVPRPANGNRKPCVAVYQRELIL